MCTLTLNGAHLKAMFKHNIFVFQVGINCNEIYEKWENRESEMAKK